MLRIPQGQALESQAGNQPCEWPLGTQGNPVESKSKLFGSNEMLACFEQVIAGELKAIRKKINLRCLGIVTESRIRKSVHPPKP